MSVQYKIPDYVRVSQDCRHLLSRIFVANPARRIAIKEIKTHPWFLKNLPRELTETAQLSVEEIMKIVEEAKTPALASCSVGAFGWVSEEDEENEEVEEEEEDEDEYEKQLKQIHESGEFCKVLVIFVACRKLQLLDITFHGCVKLVLSLWRVI